MKRILAWLLALAMAALATGLAGPATATARVGAGSTRSAPPTRPVIVVGLPGLRWSDVSARGTPAIWRLAEAGSVGSLAVMAINPVTCPADDWLTLNSGARAAATVDAPGVGPCASSPPVSRGPAVAPGQQQSRGEAGVPGPARIPTMPDVERANVPYSYRPYWGALAGSAPGCATAVGPGAGLALADRAGRIGRYLAALPHGEPAVVRGLLERCRLSVIDLGGLLSSHRDGSALAAADAEVGAIVAAAPSGAEIVLAGLGDVASVPHLHVVVVSGPGFRSGLLTSDATRQPGVVTITDLTPSIARWLGSARQASESVDTRMAGSPLRRVARGPLTVAVRMLIGQDTADQVTRSPAGGLFIILAAVLAVALALIGLAFTGGGEARARRREALCAAVGIVGAGLPAGTFLAGIVPWAQLTHPALWLWGLSLAWAAAIGVLALGGPWRRDPFGPPGVVAAVTVAVIGIDVMTGSRLQPGAPFGLSLTEANRFYGIGNNAVGGYAVTALVAGAWAAGALLRTGRSRRAAVAAAGTVGLVAVFVAAWPGFGAKVGGTIAMVPAFVVLLVAIGGVRITLRRGLLIAVSGVAVIAVFAVADYLGLAPLSHQGQFVGSVLHGGAASTLHRKISANLSTLVQAWYSPIAAAVAVAAGIVLAWPGKLGPRVLRSAMERCQLLRGTLFAAWLAVVIAWFADDSGVRVVAASLPVALPLTVVLVLRSASLPTATGRRELISQQPDASVTMGRTG